MLNNVRIVLVGTTHPGNIGAAARAMKNMGLDRLNLVSPKIFPHVDATARAAGADDILARAVVTDSLDDAIADCSLVVGASARIRNLSLPLYNPREAAAKIVLENKTQNVALLFGREHSGLSNEELHRCNFHLYIPTETTFSSLNLAAAVQVVVYELRMALMATVPEPEYQCEFVTAKQMNLFYEHLQEVLLEVGFLKPHHGKKIMLRLRRLFNRASVEKTELNILRGILTKIKRYYPEIIS